MAKVYRTLSGAGSVLGTSSADFYVVAAGKVGFVRALVLSNFSQLPVAVRLWWRDASLTAQPIVYDRILVANDTYILYPELVLAAGCRISALASAAGSVGITASGYEIELG